MTVEFEGANEFIEFKDGVITLTDVSDQNEGNYTITLKLEDELGLSNSYEINIQVLVNITETDEVEENASSIGTLFEVKISQDQNN